MTNPTAIAKRLSVDEYDTFLKSLHSGAAKVAWVDGRTGEERVCNRVVATKVESILGAPYPHR
jgi:hypothetical protein